MKDHDRVSQPAQVEVGADEIGVWAAAWSMRKRVLVCGWTKDVGETDRVALALEEGVDPIGLEADAIVVLVLEDEAAILDDVADAEADPEKPVVVASNTSVDFGEVAVFLVDNGGEEFSAIDPPGEKVVQDLTFDQHVAGENEPINADKVVAFREGEGKKHSSLFACDIAGSAAVSLKHEKGRAGLFI